MSPFDKRMGSYTKTALNRSNSRGPSNGALKPPKLSWQQSVGSNLNRRPSNTGIASPIRNSRRLVNEIDWSSDLELIKNKLIEYDMSVSRYVEGVQCKQQLANEVVQRVE